MKHPPAILAIVALFATPMGLHAEAEIAVNPKAASLDIGSAAPEFKVDSWIKGEPIAKFDNGKTYLIECWATWCFPCLAQIPHVDGLQKKFRDQGLVVIGMNVWDGPKAGVEKFVKEQGDKMGYRVAFDGKKNGHLAMNWLKAAGVDGIPHAFVVRDGKILWHGHPGELDDATVGDMVAGKFDAAKVLQSRKEEKAREEKFQKAVSDVASLAQVGKYDEAIAKTEALAPLMPEEDRPRIQTICAEFHIAKGDVAGALARLETYSRMKSDDAEAQYDVALKLLNAEAFKDKRSLALPYAKKAAALDSDLGTRLLLACAEYAAGNKDAALGDLQRLAKSPEFDDEDKLLISQTTEAVKAGKPLPLEMSDDEEDETGEE